MASFASFFFFLVTMVDYSAFPASGQDHVIRSIFVLAGQSNMAGRGGVVNRTWDGYVPLDSQPSPSIFRLNPNLRWEPAQEPVDDGFDGDTCGVGPGMAFANDLLGHEDGHELGAVGLVPFAVGGTKINQWARGSSLYNRLVQRANEAVTGGGTMRALLWYQGESDTVDLGDANTYGARIAQFFMDVRSDLNHPDLPIMQVALATGQGPYIDKVREAQLGLCLHNVVTVDAKGLQVAGDFVHLTTNGQVQLGHMLANAYRSFLHI